MKKLFGKRKKKSASEAGSIASGRSASGYNISPKKDLVKIHKAAFDGDLTKLKSYLKRGDVNQLDKENRTPLHLACASGKYEAVRLLVEHPNINLNMCDNEWKSALMKCVQCEHKTCLHILLDKEADVSLCDSNGNTALHMASSIPNRDMCSLLCDYQADPWAKNKDGATPLHIVSGLGSDDIVLFFLEAGVDVNDADNFGKTALMYAAHKGHLSTVKLLLAQRANPAIRDSKGWTADDYASMDGFHPISHVILEHNTKQTTPSHKSIKSMTPQTTPQRLAVNSGLSQQNNFAMSLGSPAIDGGDNLSQSDDDSLATTSKRSKDHNSWASSESEEDHVYAVIKKKTLPKMNLLHMINQKKKKSDAAQVITPGVSDTGSSPPSQPPSKTTTNLFLTSSARQQLEKQESEDVEPENPINHGMRERYDSKSARGLPVSPTKPPIPQPRSSTSLNDQAVTNPSSSPAMPNKRDEDEDDSPWDSSSKEDEEESEKVLAPRLISGERPPIKPSKDVMKQLGFDESEMKNLYDDVEDESITASERSAANKHPTPDPVKAPGKISKPMAADTDSDSWDNDIVSDDEPQKNNPNLGGMNFIQKSLDLKFDDESDSEPDYGGSAPSPASKPNVKHVDDDGDTDDSWNSEDLVQSPAKATSYASSSLAKTKDAQSLTPKRASPHLPQEDAGSRRSSGLQNKMSDLGIIYGEGSDSEESEMESESSWEVEKKQRAPLYNNLRDLEREKKERLEEERKREEEEKGRKEEEKRKLAMEEKDKRKMQEEAEKAKKDKERKLEERRRAEVEAEKRRNQEEERRKEKENEEQRLKRERELELMNKMNEELERKNAVLRKKAEEGDRKMREEKQRAMMSLKTEPMNESLRNALERAVEVTSDSGDSNPESFDSEAVKPPLTSVQQNLESPPIAAASQSAPPPASGTKPSGMRPSPRRDRIKNRMDLDTLTETDSEDDGISISENQLPAPLHKSPLSDSLKLIEEKQSLSMQLAREQDVAADAKEKLSKIERDKKQLRQKERTLTEEKKNWELLRVELDAEKRKLSFEVKNLQEILETVNLKLSRYEERCKILGEQLQVEKEEKKEQEILIRDLQTDLKNATSNAKQLELERDEAKRRLVNEQETKNLTEKIGSDSFNLNKLIKDEASRDQKVESLEQLLQEKTAELIKIKADRDRHEDASIRYKDALAKLRSQDADQHSNLASMNQELNEKLDEAEEQHRESEEALQLTALQIVQYKQAYENIQQQIADEKRMKESALHDLEMLNNRQDQLKRDLEDSRSSLLREQERLRKMDDAQEKMRDKEADLQGKLLSAETRAGRLENELQVAQLSHKQRAEELAKRENDAERLRQEVKENDRILSKLQRENVEQSGEIKALKIELHQRESDCIQMRQEKEDLRSRSTLSVSEQQDKFNARLTDLHHEHENERVAFETRNVQLAQQVEHWKSEAERIEREKERKDEELAQAQQDRIETHKKLGYADAFSKSASKEQQLMMDENTRCKEEMNKFQSQISLLEQKLEEKATMVSELQKEVDSYHQSSANASRQIDTLNESQRLTESTRARIEQQLKEIELENIRIKSELESANSWKERLQKGREEEAHTRVLLEERVSVLECDKLLAEEKLAAEISSAKMLRAEVEGHRNMWESEVKARSKASVELSRAEKDMEDEKKQTEVLKAKLARALEERKTFKTRYEHLKKDKQEADRRAESYSSEEVKKAQWENEKLKEELRRFRSHVETSYVDRSELEAARQEERIKAQAALTPTLDQVNTYLKDRQIAQEVVDQLRQKNEEHRYMQAMRKIGMLEEELATARRKNEAIAGRKIQQQEAEISHLYENARKQNEVLKLQLARSKQKSDEYKESLVKERKKFQGFFSTTLGGSLIPNGTDAPQMSLTNGLGPSPNITGLASTSLTARPFSSTPRKDATDPLLTKLRNKLDFSIAQHLAGTREEGQASSGSSAATPRSDQSHQQFSADDLPGTSRLNPASNEYMSFLLT